MIVEFDKNIVFEHPEEYFGIKRRIGKYKAHNPLVDAFMTIFVFLLMLKA